MLKVFTIKLVTFFETQYISTVTYIPRFHACAAHVSTSLAVFRQRLNTFLFSRSYQDTII